MTTVSLLDAAQRLARAETTSRELTEACLARIEEHDSALRAFITVESDGARRGADEADARRREGQVRGPLDGLPLAVKDNLAVAGRVTTMGSAIYRSHLRRRTPVWSTGSTRTAPYGSAQRICTNSRSASPRRTLISASAATRGYRADTGRLERRVRRRRLRRDGTGRPRLRHLRLHPDPRSGLRHRRAQTTYGRVSSYGCYRRRGAWTTSVC